MYRVASASKYLDITGFRIDDIKIAKKAWLLPGQSYSIFDISLISYTFEVKSMSAKKLPYILPVVFTIGPRSDDMDSLHKHWRRQLLPMGEIGSNAENEREAEVAKANAELAMKKAKWAKDSQLAVVEAKKAMALLEDELQKEVEIMNALKLKVQEATLELYKKQKEADAFLYRKVKEAEAQKGIVKANIWARKQVADSELYAKEKEAEGLVALAKAQSTQIKTLISELRENFALFREYLTLNG